MKIFNWIQQHKYPLMVGLFFVTAALLIMTFVNSLHKDHSLDLVKQQLQLQEDARQQIIKLRDQYQAVYDQQSKEILSYQIRDSLANIKVIQINNAIQKISTPKYAKEKTDVIDAYSDSDLLQYFNNLPVVPEPNDY